MQKLRNLKTRVGDFKSGDIKISQQNKVTYLARVLDNDMSGESIVSRVMNKISGRLNFLYRKQ